MMKFIKRKHIIHAYLIAVCCSIAGSQLSALRFKTAAMVVDCVGIALYFLVNVFLISWLISNVRESRQFSKEIKRRTELLKELHKHLPKKDN